MKSTGFIFTAIMAVFTGAFTFAQTHDHSQITTFKTETFKVSGNCDMCKVRIENAAKIEGVNKSEWNKDSKVLTLVYNPSLVKSDDILSKIAVAGHDNVKFKTTEKVYENLPGCCRYERMK